MLDIVPQAVFSASLVLSAGLTGFALAGAGLTALFFAPLSFQRLDYQRADSLVRRAVHAVLPIVAGTALAGAVLAFAGLAITAGLLLLMAAGGVLLVRWVLNPIAKKPRLPGAVRRKSRQRILALQVLLVVSLIFPAALFALAAHV